MKHLLINHLSLRTNKDIGKGDFAHRRWFRLARLVTLGILASVGLIALVELFSSDRFSISKPTDFVQDYAMGRAILERKDPYASLETLTSQFGLDLWHHPCPHPPPLAVIMAAIAMFPYEKAMLIWLALSLVGLLISVRTVFGLSWFATPVCFLISLLWYPIHEDLVMGQIMSILLTLLALAWVSLRKGQQIKAGIFIGLVLSLKLIAWPLIIYFLIRRKFQAATSALATFVGANLIVGLVIGIDRILYYYLQVGSQVASIYRDSPFNYSVFSIGPRFFSGTRSTLASLLRSDPLINAPQLAVVASTLLALIVFFSVFYLVLRCSDEERAFATLICLSVVLSPTAWWFYFVLLLIPITAAAKMKHGFSKVAIACCLVATYVPPLVQPLFGSHVSYWTGLLMICPLLAVGLLIFGLMAPELRNLFSVNANQIRRSSYRRMLADPG